MILVSFLYFFNADRRIVRILKPGFVDFDENKIVETQAQETTEDTFSLPVEYYLSTRFKFKKVRSVNHYSQNFWISFLRGITFQPCLPFYWPSFS